MALSTHTVLACFLNVHFVIANVAASCDVIKCMTCDTGGKCAACKDGYYNYKGNCYPCRQNCTSCKDAYFCTMCDDGFHTYESVHYTSCEKCPPYCVKCNSTTFCSECTPGHYGKHCGESCNACKDGACSKTDCTHGCIDGHFQLYFPDNYSYCSRCFSNCKRCTNSSHCNTCHDGYIRTSIGAGSICNQCNLNCESCSTTLFCDSCPPGRWNSTCKSHCPDGCKNKTCGISTGRCNDGCAEGYYMKADGVCYPCSQSSSGCHCPDFQYYNGSMCVPCTDGYWGRLCNETCNLNCLDITCTNVDGRCDQCNQTDYGHFCEFKCNNKCNNPLNGSSVCDNNGECLLGCHNGWLGRTCDTVDPKSETSHEFTTPLKTPVSTTTVSEFTSSRPKQQTEDEADVPVAIIAGSFGGAVFLLIIGACIGVLCTVLYFKRRNDTSCASGTDPSYENTPDTNIEGISTYTDLCHVSGKETPYSIVTRTEYENMNV